MTNGKQGWSSETFWSFWTTLPGVLTGLAALIGALGGIFALVRSQSPKPPDPQTAAQEAILNRLNNLYDRGDSCPKNSWFAYVIDFTDLGDITRDYVRFLTDNPHGDRDSRIQKRLEATLERVRQRNEAGTVYFEWKDSPGLHSHTLPTRFQKILSAVDADKQLISVDEQNVLEQMIHNWYRDAGITPSDKTDDEVKCREP
jgi:hypothetical protein